MVLKSRNVYSKRIFIRKGMVMSGINYVRTGVKCVALFVDSRPLTTEVRLSVCPKKKIYIFFLFFFFFLIRQIYSV